MLFQWIKTEEKTLTADEESCYLSPVKDIQYFFFDAFLLGPGKIYLKEHCLWFPTEFNCMKLCKTIITDDFSNWWKTMKDLLPQNQFLYFLIAALVANRILKLEFSVKSDVITQMLTDALIRGWQTTYGVNVSTWLQIKKMKAPLIIADLDVPYTDLAEIHVAISSFFQVILRGSSFSLVVFHPHPPFLVQNSNCPLTVLLVDNQ